MNEAGPRAHSGAKVEAPLGSYNFPLASVCPRTTPTAGQPMGVGHVGKEQSA